MRVQSSVGLLDSEKKLVDMQSMYTAELADLRKQLHKEQQGKKQLQNTCAQMEGEVSRLKQALEVQRKEAWRQVQEMLEKVQTLISRQTEAEEKEASEDSYHGMYNMIYPITIDWYE